MIEPGRIVFIRKEQLALRRAQPSESRDLADWIAERHYLRSVPAGFVHALEFALEGKRVGAALIGRPNARQYDADVVLELTRLYFIDATPMCTESHALKLLRRHVRTWLPRIRLLLAYSDPEQGHEGTIYVADGWTPFGLTDGAWGYGWHSRAGRRDQRVSKKLRWVRTP